MNQAEFKKLSLKEKREGLSQWLFERNWPTDILLDGKKHDTCRPGQLPGNWKLIGYGVYIGNDWHNHQYVGFRCTRCGMMVQFNWTEPNEGETPEPIKKIEVIP